MDDEAEYIERLMLELKAIEAWEARWGGEDEDASLARRLRRLQIIRRLQNARHLAIDVEITSGSTF